MRKQVETFVAATAAAAVAHALPLSQLLCVAFCCYCSVAAAAAVAVCILEQSATAIPASAHTHTSWRIRIDSLSLPLSRRAPLRRSEQNWGVHCSCFACLLSVRVCVCMCVKGRHVGKFSLHFFLFIAVLRAQVYYLICFVMYTLQRITFKVDKKYAKISTSMATSDFVTHLFVLFVY